MKTIKDRITENNTLIKNKDMIFDVDLNKYYGLFKWKIVGVEAWNVLGKDVEARYSELIVGDNADKCILLNIDIPTFGKNYEYYNIKPNVRYHIVYIENKNTSDDKQYFLAIADGIVLSTQHLQHIKDRISEKLKDIEYDIKHHVGYADYIPTEINDMLVRLYNDNKIADPLSWVGLRTRK